MRSVARVALGAVTLGVIVTDAARGQDEPATGFAIAIHATGAALPDLFASAAGVPQFSVGHRGERFGLGVGLGVTAVRSTDETTITGFGTTTDRLTLTTFQLGPSGWVGLWRSRDRRTSAHLAAGLSVGRASASQTTEFVPDGGTPTITEASAAGAIFGVRAGLGADHFLHRHFALGLEAGLLGVFASNIGEEDGLEELSLGASGTYTALRVMVVF